AIDNVPVPVIGPPLSPVPAPTLVTVPLPPLWQVTVPFCAMLWMLDPTVQVPVTRCCTWLETICAAPTLVLETLYATSAVRACSAYGVFSILVRGASGVPLMVSLR